MRDLRPRRSCLTVPGSNPRMLSKAAGLAADQVILDLEDAVAPSQKSDARANVVQALQVYGSRVVSVRINAVDTSWCYRDVIDVIEAAGERVATVIVPKVDAAADLEFVDRLLMQIELSFNWEVGRIGLEAQIESARGVQSVDEIARASGRLEALVLGPGDLAAALGLGHLTIGQVAEDVWPHIRTRLLVAARANGLLAIDGPYARIADSEGLERAARASAAMGYDGQWVIHPSQIEAVNRIYSPDPEVYRRAVGILRAYGQAVEEGRGAATYEGEMIDAATCKMAEQVARRGRWLGLS